MSQGTCETVKIKTDDGYTVINESDFNEKEHKIYTPKTVKVKADKKADKKAD